MATTASRELAKWLAYNVNLFQLSAPLLVFGFRIVRPGIRVTDTRLDLSARHVFKSLLKCYHGLSEPAFVFASSGMQPLVRVLIELTLALAMASLISIIAAVALFLQY